MYICIHIPSIKQKRKVSKINIDLNRIKYRNLGFGFKDRI